MYTYDKYVLGARGIMMMMIPTTTTTTTTTIILFQFLIYVNS